MGFRLKEEDESLITPMALAHPLHPIKSRSGNKCTNLGVVIVVVNIIFNRMNKKK